MEKIILSNEVLKYLDDLVYTLFEKEYFSYPSYALSYVDRILDYLYTSIASTPSKQTPEKLEKYGKFYLTYKANTNTTWIIFYDYYKIKDVYLIRHITNNHQPEVKFLNS